MLPPGRPEGVPWGQRCPPAAPTAMTWLLAANKRPRNKSRRLPGPGVHVHTRVHACEGGRPPAAAGSSSLFSPRPSVHGSAFCPRTGPGARLSPHSTTLSRPELHFLPQPARLRPPPPTPAGAARRGQSRRAKTHLPAPRRRSAAAESELCFPGPGAGLRLRGPWAAGTWAARGGPCGSSFLTVSGWQTSTLRGQRVSVTPLCA